jgi:hypothetical protein
MTQNKGRPAPGSSGSRPRDSDQLSEQIDAPKKSTPSSHAQDRDLSAQEARRIIHSVYAELDELKRSVTPEQWEVERREGLKRAAEELKMIMRSNGLTNSSAEDIVQYIMDWCKQP